MSNEAPYAAYRVTISHRAYKFLSTITAHERSEIVAHIDQLQQDLSSLDIKKLKGFDDLYRIRSGTYRIVFQPSEATHILAILLIAHRKEVYELLQHFLKLKH